MNPYKKELLAIPGVKEFLNKYPKCDIQIVAKRKKIKTSKVTFQGVYLTRSSGNNETYIVTYPNEGEVAFSSKLPTKSIQDKLDAAHQFIEAPVAKVTELNKIASTPCVPMQGQTTLGLFDVIKAMFYGANDEIPPHIPIQGYFLYQR